MNLKNYSNEELLSRTKVSVQNEKEATLEVLHHLREIERRRLYSDRGFSSVFEMCTKHFGYSEGEAYRRVSAMRLIHEAPELEQKIEQGQLTLTVAAQIRTFCKRTKKDVREVASLVAGKSSRETERELLKLVPQTIPQEKVRAVTEEHTAVTLVLSKELKARLDQLLAFRSHKNPQMTYAGLVEDLAKLGEKAWSQQRKTTSAPKSNAEIRREVFRAADHRCTYQDSVTGRRCESKVFLEKDHIQPRALGGGDEIENLRVLCRSHNQSAAVKMLGADKMKSFFRN